MIHEMNMMLNYLSFAHFITTKQSERKRNSVYYGHGKFPSAVSFGSVSVITQ